MARSPGKLRASLNGDIKELSRAFQAKQIPVARAVTAAMFDLALAIRTKGKIQFARALSERWGKQWKVDPHPSRPGAYSIDAAVNARHQIPFSEIFETGGTISPKRGRFLWLPMEDNLPFRLGNKRRTPENYIAQYNQDLIPIVLHGKHYLGATVRVSRATARGLAAGRGVTKGVLRRGLSGGGKNGVQRTVLLFHGVPSIKLRKRLDIYAMIEKERATLPQLYAKHLRDGDD